MWITKVQKYFYNIMRTIHSPFSKGRNFNILIILFITFLDFLNISIFFGTIIPLILADHNQFTLLKTVAEKNFIFTLLLILLPIGQFLIAPLWGQAADRYGRKKILTFTLSISAVGYCLMSFAIVAKLLILLIIGRMIISAVAVNYSIAQASLADMSGAQNKTSGFNIQQMVVSLAFMTGPFYISFLAHNNHYENTYWGLMIGYLMAVLAVVFLFSETLLKLNAPTLTLPRDYTGEGTKSFFPSPACGGGLEWGRFKIPARGLTTWCIFMLGFWLFFQFSGEMLYQLRHLPNDTINHIFGSIGITVFVIQLLIVQPLTRKLKPQKIIPYAIGLVGVSIITMGLVPIHPYFFIALFFYCVGIAFFLTNIYTYFSNQVKPKEQARTMSMLLSTQALMTIIGAAFGGLLMDYFVYTPFVIGGGIILVSLFFYKRESVI
jgi:DHA1 family tetracycline resistance protein-like MFS transporter